MFKHLIIATDGSELAGKAVTQGSAMAAALGARMTIVMATEPWRVASGEFASIAPLDDYNAACAATATRILKSAEAAAHAAGLPLERIDTFHIREAFPLKASSRPRNGSQPISSPWPRTADAASRAYCSAVRPIVSSRTVRSPC